MATSRSRIGAVFSLTRYLLIGMQKQKTSTIVGDEKDDADQYNKLTLLVGSRYITTNRISGLFVDWDRFRCG